jgi:hypothetical protein
MFQGFNGCRAMGVPGDGNGVDDALLSVYLFVYIIDFSMYMHEVEGGERC